MHLADFSKSLVEEFKLADQGQLFRLQKSTVRLDSPGLHLFLQFYTHWHNRQNSGDHHDALTH